MGGNPLRFIKISKVVRGIEYASIALILIYAEI
jgi:hypothetical protein